MMECPPKKSKSALPMSIILFARIVRLNDALKDGELQSDLEF